MSGCTHPSLVVHVPSATLPHEIWATWKMAMNYDGMNGSEMDTTDSRKRPLDGDTENGVTKRSNQGGDGTSSYTMQTESEEVIVEAAQQSYAGGASSSHAISKPSYLENVGFWGGDPGEGQQASMTTAGVNPAFSSYQGENINMKILVPSIAAGAIIGKGGETIAQVQKEAGARVKMSKANDFYPGTTERVCLIMGPADSVRKVHNFIMEKIREKPDPTPKLDESKSNFERHRQVKILVPNSTAGMIIGKGGNYIKQIKEESGAYVQISQKSKETNLPERCVTIAGEMEANKKAVDLILQKIVEDPQSGSCPNISYADFSGPVASANPTGSPFANTAFMQSRSSDMGLNNNNFAGGGFSNFGFNGNSFGNQLGSAMNFNLNPGAMTAGGGMTNAAMENLKMTLRNSGFAEQATEEISLAMNTLAGYGILGMGMMGGMQQNPGNMGGGGGMGSLGLGGGGSAGMMAGTNTTSASTAGSTGFLNTSNSSSSATSLFGPVGSGSSGLGSSGSTVTNSSLFGSSSPSIPTDRYGSSPMNDSFTGTAGYPSVVPYTPGERSPSLGQNMNQNSFGLGTGMYSPTDDKSATTTKQDMEVPENIVGAILGPGGKGIVEIQQFTGTNIQISKKGIYMPGTRNRIVSITGTPSNIGRAQCVIQQRIAQEEMKRARNAQSAAR